MRGVQARLLGGRDRDDRDLAHGFGALVVVAPVIHPGYDVLAIMLGAVLASRGSFRLLTP